jgi:hypothetical protein
MDYQAHRRQFTQTDEENKVLLRACFILALPVLLIMLTAGLLVISLAVRFL